MSESRKHRETAQRIARRYDTEYNNGPGADNRTHGMTVEVETQGTVSDAKRQLRGHKGLVFVAGADAQATQRACEEMQGTTIGVMDPYGNVLKNSTRR